jgi:hypothetical protein
MLKVNVKGYDASERRDKNIRIGNIGGTTGEELGRLGVY